MFVDGAAKCEDTINNARTDVKLASLLRIWISNCDINSIHLKLFFQVQKGYYADFEILIYYKDNEFDDSFFRRIHYAFASEVVSNHRFLFDFPI